MKPRRKKAEEEAVDAYEVRCFESIATKPLWAKVFPAVGKRPYTGGLLWAARRPQYAASEIQHLTWLDDRLLLCRRGDAAHPLPQRRHRLGDRRLERPWEFQRRLHRPQRVATLHRPVRHRKFPCHGDQR